MASAIGKVYPVDVIRRALAPELKKTGAQRVILFGSYARGEADSYSDIDLIIIADSHRPFVERFKDFLGVRRISPVKSIDMFIYTPEEFQQLQSTGRPFVSKVLADGKVIYEAEPDGRGKTVAAASRTRSQHS